MYDNANNVINEFVNQTHVNAKQIIEDLVGGGRIDQNIANIIYGEITREAQGFVSNLRNKYPNQKVTVRMLREELGIWIQNIMQNINMQSRNMNRFAQPQSGGMWQPNMNSWGNQGNGWGQSWAPPRPMMVPMPPQNNTWGGMGQPRGAYYPGTQQGGWQGQNMTPPNAYGGNGGFKSWDVGPQQTTGSYYHDFNKPANEWQPPQAKVQNNQQQVNQRAQTQEGQWTPPQKKEEKVFKGIPGFDPVTRTFHKVTEEKPSVPVEQLNNKFDRPTKDSSTIAPYKVIDSKSAFIKKGDVIDAKKAIITNGDETVEFKNVKLNVPCTESDAILTADEIFDISKNDKKVTVIDHDKLEVIPVEEVTLRELHEQVLKAVENEKVESNKEFGQVDLIDKMLKNKSNRAAEAYEKMLVDRFNMHLKAEPFGHVTEETMSIQTLDDIFEFMSDSDHYLVSAAQKTSTYAEVLSDICQKSFSGFIKSLKIYSSNNLDDMGHVINALRHVVTSKGVIVGDYWKHMSITTSDSSTKTECRDIVNKVKQFTVIGYKTITVTTNNVDMYLDDEHVLYEEIGLSEYDNNSVVAKSSIDGQEYVPKALEFLVDKFVKNKKGVIQVKSSSAGKSNNIFIYNSDLNQNIQLSIERI